MTDLSGKTALITGGCQGIGRGIAEELAKAGACVCLTFFPTEIERATAKAAIVELRNRGYSVDAVPMDVTSPESIDAGLEELFGRVHRLHILVNNAGVMQQNKGLRTSSHDFDKCYSVNLKGVWQLTQALLPRLQTIKGAAVVNIASTGARTGVGEIPAYCASKAAVVSLTQSLALALAPFDIRVNAVCPGIVWTPMSEKYARLMQERIAEETLDMQQFLEQIRQMLPLRRIPTAEDIGHAVVFLASIHAQSITGQSLNVDGGFLMN